MKMFKVSWTHEDFAWHPSSQHVTDIIAESIKEAKSILLKEYPHAANIVCSKGVPIKVGIIDTRSSVI